MDSLHIRKIKSNKIQCKQCTEIIESKNSHDFKWCKCQMCAVDGGHDYLKRLGNSMSFIELSEFYN